MKKIYFFLLLVLFSHGIETSAQTTSTNTNNFPEIFLRRELSILAVERDSSHNSLRSGQCGNDQEDDGSGTNWTWGWNGGNCSSGDEHSEDNTTGNGGNCSGGSDSNDNDDSDDGDDDGEDGDDDDTDNDSGNGGNCSGGGGNNDDDDSEDGDDDGDDDDTDNDGGNGGNCSGGGGNDDNDDSEDGDDDGEDDDTDNDGSNGGNCSGGGGNDDNDDSEDGEDDGEDDDTDNDGGNGGNCSGGGGNDDDNDSEEGDDDGEDDGEDDDSDNDGGDGGNCSGGGGNDDDDDSEEGDDDGEDDDTDNDGGNGGNCSGGGGNNDGDDSEEGDDDGEDDDTDNDGGNGGNCSGGGGNNDDDDIDNDNNGGDNGDESEDDEENNDGDDDDQEEDDNDGDGENGGGDDDGDNGGDGNGEETDEEEDGDSTDNDGDDSDGDGDNGGDDNGGDGEEPIECLGYECPADFNGDCGQTIEPSITGTPILNGNYSNLSYSDLIVPTDCGQSILRTWTFNDCDGILITCVQNLFYQDTTAPVFENTPVQITVSCDQLPLDPITATDNCSSENVIVTYTESEFSGGCLPTIERVYTATDACGNASTFTQYITVVDNVAPTISGIDMFVSLSCGSAIPSDQPTITDNCSEVEIDFSEVSQGSACNQTITRVWTATDVCGNSETFTQIIQISDETPPVFTNIPSNLNLFCGSELPALNATAVDNCSEVNITHTDQLISSNGNCQTIIRTYRAIDECGNSALAIQEISFIDDESPVLSDYPENYVGVCGENIEVPVITATDNCATDLQVYFTESSEIIGCSVITTRVWSTFDDCGNTTIHEQTIELIDNSAPVISPVSDVTVSCNEIPALTIIAIDECGFVETNFVDQTIGSGCSYDIQRTWTASDACGNTSQVIQLIHVVDDQAPVFTYVPASFSLACGNPPASQNPIVIDNCSSGIVPLLTEEISGTPCEQIITRVWRAYDDCGNMSMAIQVITIADNVAPVLVGVPPSVTLSCTDLPIVPTVTANDNCSGQVDVTFTETTTGEGCGFQVTRIWRAVDACGNERLATQNIYVNDNVAPTWIGVPADVTINCSDVLPALADPSATDNCTEVLESFYYEFEESTACGSIVHRNWVATDACGNTSTATQRISISDTEAPLFTRTPPSNLTVNCASIPEPIEVNAVDNCSAVTVSVTEEVETGGCPYIIRRTYSAIDACGNVATFVEEIQVLDDVPPVLNNVPGNTTITCGEEWPLYDVSAEDDCAGVLAVELNETIEVVGCSEILTRVYTATDLCGNEVSAIQIIEKLDTAAPELSDYPQDMNVTCGNIPDAAILTADDACQGAVEVVFEESIQSLATETSTCILTTAEAFFGDMALWLPGIQGLSVNYVFTPNNGALTVNEALGTAHITGEVQNATNPEQRWIIDFHLNNKKNWSEWSAMGRSYKDDFNIAGDNYLNWDYYELDPSSQLIGAGTLAGSVLQITHAPSTYYYGFQVGVAANNRNTEYGMSGWIYYNGTVNGAVVSGHGDFFAENNCCEEQIIERTWTAVDCAGNTQTHTQTIYVNAAPTPNQLVIAEQPTLKVNHTVDQNFALKFSVPTTNDVIIDLYDASGQLIRNVYTGFAEEEKSYEVSVKAPSVENAMYFFKLTTESHTIMQPALMLR